MLRKPLIFFIISLISLAGQAQMSDWQKNKKPEYCKWSRVEIKGLIGKKLKIWHEGGVYPTLNTSDNYKWPSINMKVKGGESGWNNYTPKAGDSGVVVHFFTNRGSPHKYIIVLDIKGNYVPVGCNYLTQTNKWDIHERSMYKWKNDSMANVEYARGCAFKLYQAGNGWSRTGRTNLDKQSEAFACNLRETGVDTVLLCKYIFDKGSLPQEKAFVLWLQEGRGYIKSFFNNERRQPTENTIVAFDAQSLINYFFEHRIDTVTTKPADDKYLISHNMGYSIQLHTNTIFFREQYQDLTIASDPQHPKSVWWKMIAGQLSGIQKEQ